MPARRNTPNARPRLHPNGKRLIAIRDVKRVYGHAFAIPLEYFIGAAGRSEPKPSTMVTPEQVEDALNGWDARSILEDIDTQWGAVPEGGCLDVAGGWSSEW
ncbi:hypothetical protein C8Q76DRAFT_793070 [Earliella scabrosa]|nr:hypothetical protein C8Q76DRAFT_793070 [Earliella scabrosa]